MTDFGITPETTKAWQEKQKERDRISSIMGEYLLKGYRMLDSYCSDCNVSCLLVDPLPIHLAQTSPPGSIKCGGGIGKASLISTASG